MPEFEVGLDDRLVGEVEELRSIACTDVEIQLRESEQTVEYDDYVVVENKEDDTAVFVELD